MITKQELLDKIEHANSNDEYLRIVRKYIIHGIPYVFKDNANSYYDFREQIANHWHVGFQEVLILGSGKLGYSYHKDSVFSDESDIDVAIVNQSLFESFYLEIICLEESLEFKQTIFFIKQHYTIVQHVVKKKVSILYFGNIIY